MTDGRGDGEGPSRPAASSPHPRCGGANRPSRQPPKPEVAAPPPSDATPASSQPTDRPSNQPLSLASPASSQPTDRPSNRPRCPASPASSQPTDRPSNRPSVSSLAGFFAADGPTVEPTSVSSLAGPSPVVRSIKFFGLMHGHQVVGEVDQALGPVDGRQVRTGCADVLEESPSSLTLDRSDSDGD
ncbi:hypothetical protein BV898_11389 [Hypsibius exemplaris]|uniref:Uncharacterized protein n=1 Tax=Hypsibius exemplaris TaxID=2072580 RepID=A0A1W0WGV2_HYPEX|nr:hypothetical protein BV898_11389 [Hypsibius exemplaris]